MSLKSSIVIRNEYTIKGADGKGSRGSSPKDFILDYMARVGATEPVTPARRHDLDDYIEKYMARESAVEGYDDIPSMKHKMKRNERFGGVAFTSEESALSDDGLHEMADLIQQQYEQGKTVLKTIISFDEEYLREQGIIDEDFHCKKRGDYRGNIDQMKLRQAIMHGMQRLGKRYDDMQYVGVIQVDTKHVHCHLCMVDKGVGHLMSDGTQRGKLLAKDKDVMRRGMDNYLDRKKMIKQLTSSVDYDKRNVVCYIKRFTHRTMQQQGLPQFLLACLPENRNWWRASTNRKEMRKANTIVREYVEELLAQPDSGYQDALEQIARYADYRKKKEELSDVEVQQLLDNGKEQLMQKCMDSVYSVLREIPQSQMMVRTPMLESMSMDYDEMASQAMDDPMMEFGFRLRSYSSRMEHHRKEYHKFRDEYQNYESYAEKAEDSKALGDYLRLEAEYNRMLMVKYQHFLSFLPAEENLEEEFEELMKEKERLANLKKMRQDKSMLRMKPSIAEEYGLQVYGQHGGRRVRLQPQILDMRIARFEQTVYDREVAFREKLQDVGLNFDGEKITQTKAYAFDEVKALDLHHLGYDFPYDAKISKRNVDAFVEAAKTRYESFQRAKSYLVSTGQELAVKLLPERDVLFMRRYAEEMTGKSLLESTRPKTGQKRKASTIRLGTDYTMSMKTMIQSTIASVDLAYE